MTTAYFTPLLLLASMLVLSSAAPFLHFPFSENRENAQEKALSQGWLGDLSEDKKPALPTLPEFNRLDQPDKLNDEDMAILQNWLEELSKDEVATLQWFRRFLLTPREAQVQKALLPFLKLFG